MRLDKHIRLSVRTDNSAVQQAVGDLLSDAGKVLGAEAACCDTDPTVTVCIDPRLETPEAWRIDVGEQVTISGADALGATYGIYEFSTRFLGVDPLWFWKDLEPVRRESIEIPAQTIDSPIPAFRYRGWFINDEDLLTEWMDGSGPRDIRYPFYSQVINTAIADRIFEACLRSGCNLLIPASFVDVMNEPEAELVRRAADRGLYVTQHHIEPLGVSHFGFENYWRDRGEDVEFSYANEPERVRQTWRDYARKWVELAGDRVVWQLGLRGKADRAIWSSDKSISREEGGRFISRAMAEQMAIVRDVDKRPNPPATTTLWMEGSELMSEGSLTFPDGIVIVFADRGATQLMLDDFHESERLPQFGYGVYYHVAFWRDGPHLVQGTMPQKVAGEYAEILAKGDTDYSIVNVSSIREHVLGVQACSEVMMKGAAFSVVDFLDRWSHGNPGIRELTETFLAALPVLTGETYPDVAKATIFQSGYAVSYALRLLKWLENADGKGDAGLDAKTIALLLDSAGRFDDVIARYDALHVAERECSFRTHHLRTQAVIMRGSLRFVANLARARLDPSHLREAVSALKAMIEERGRTQTGRWENWYRGDKKEDWPRHLERAEKLLVDEG